MKIILSVLLLLLSFMGKAQKAKKYSMAEVLIYDDSKKIKLYSTPLGNSFHYIENDTLKDEYFTIVIIKKFQNFYQVNATSIFNKFKGYVKLENIGIYTRPRDFSIKLFSFPNNKSKAIIINQGDGIMARVIQVKEDWLKVVFKFNGKEYTGWLSYEYQCSNPYSTCN